MKLTILYDNEIYKKDIGLQSDWGFACLIESEYDTVLFDTGAKGEILLNNMKKLKINPLKIKKIVISHEHSDHKGGLKSLIPYLGDIKLYHLNNNVFEKNLLPITPEIPEKINKEIWTTGRIKGLVDEQSLILKGDNGGYVLTGCSHPGLENIFKIAQQIDNIKGIIGGFHGFNKFHLVENLEFICPCHCTAHKLDLKKAFPNYTEDCGVGKIIDINVRI